VRLDIGYRIQPAQILGHPSQLAIAEEGVQPTIFGIPIAVAIGIGEAY
jgi:hypothetical protein